MRAHLIHELVERKARHAPEATALAYRRQRLSYAELHHEIRAAAAGLIAHGLSAGERAAVYLEKRIETVIALFGIAAAGGVMVPVNPLLKAPQVAHVCRDSSVRILVTSSDRMVQLQEVLAECPELHTIILVDQGVPSSLPPRIRVLLWKELVTEVTNRDVHRRIDSDMAAILYTSGSTGKPKGVVLSHRNLMAGAASVASYLENGPDDRILCTLPLSFDYGLSQLTTAFHSGASAVLINYLLPQDVVNAVRDERITGLAGVPPLWGQLANLSWPETTSLRYITNSGGAMPRPVLESLRAKLPEARIYLMYGLTEAFRSTYLPPDQVMERPDSIGKAIPNADILVVRPDGTPCDVDEPGELVHRGPLVALGYWNDPEKTAERFRPLPQQPTGLPFPEIAVWSGDTVRRDAQGYLYFVGRRDDMIKVSGYRISPTEIEEVLLTIAGVREAIAFGVPHASWGQSVMAVISSVSETLDPATVIAACKKHLPAYMVPAQVVIVEHPLPRNPNGKLDRKLVQSQFANSSDESIQPRSQGAAPVRHHR